MRGVRRFRDAARGHGHRDSPSRAAEARRAAGKAPADRRKSFSNNKLEPIAGPEIGSRRKHFGAGARAKKIARVRALGPDRGRDDANPKTRDRRRAPDLAPTQKHRFVGRKGVSPRARGRARTRRSPRPAPTRPTRRRRWVPNGTERGVKWLTRANRKGGDSRRRKLTSGIVRTNESSAREKWIGRAFTNEPFAHRGNERAGYGLAQDASPLLRRYACRGGRNRRSASCR